MHITIATRKNDNSIKGFLIIVIESTNEFETMFETKIKKGLAPAINAREINASNWMIFC